jgi:Spy/CpxP family protein refolding chaperone
MKSSTRFELIFIAILVLAIASLPTAFAQMGPSGLQHPGSKGPSSQNSGEASSMESYKDRLGLTDEQAEKFAKVRSDYRKETIKKQADLQVAGVELSELMNEKKVDLGQVEKKLRQIESLKTDLAMYRIKTLFKTKEFLNDAQFEKLKTQSLRMMQHGMMGGRMEGEMSPGMGQGMRGYGKEGRGMPPGHPETESEEGEE